MSEHENETGAEASDTGRHRGSQRAPRAEQAARHRAPTHQPRPGFERSSDEDRATRLHEVLGPRTIGLLAGCLLLQVLFIASYVGAFHSPQPHALKVDVAGPAAILPQVTGQLNAIPGNPVEASAVASRAEGERNLRSGETNAVLLSNPTSGTSTLLVSSAQGSSLSTAVSGVLRQAAAAQSTRLSVQDLVPAAAKDGRGLSSFYLVIGWLVGGYLMGTLLSIRQGNRARNFRRSLWRLIGCLGYAAVSGVAGALVVGSVGFGSLPGGFWPVAGIGTLVVLVASVFTVTATSVLGVFGVGVSILVFVVAGNPSAGGAYGYGLLPEPWRSVGPWLPNGAGVDAIRSVVYFDGAGIGRPILVLATWLAASLALYFLVAGRLYFGPTRDVWGPRRHRRPGPVRIAAHPDGGESS